MPNETTYEIEPTYLCPRCGYPGRKDKMPGNCAVIAIQCKSETCKHIWNATRKQTVLVPCVIRMSIK